MVGVVFNELSLPSPQDDLSDVEIAAFVEKGLAVLARADGLRTDIPFFVPQIVWSQEVTGRSESFSTVIARSKNRQRDVFRRFQSKASKNGLGPVVDENATYYYENNECIGLGYAAMTEGLTLSLPVSSVWDDAFFEVSAFSIAEGSDGDLSEVQNKYSVKNVSSVDMLEVHWESVLRLALPKRYDGKTVWMSCKSYPHIQFLDRVKGDLDRVALGSPESEAILSRLIELEIAVAKWESTGGPVPQWASKISPESESRINDELVNFRDNLANGEIYTFSDHARFTPGAGRIHFRMILEKEERFIRIAYIGKKIE